MSYSHKHARRLWRLLCPPALVYTEMLAAAALARGKRAHLLDAPPLPAPVALQLGGSSAADMAQAAKMGADAGYAEININCGCPSPRVKKAAFGACLMQTPALAAELVAAVKAVCALPVTVKCRLAVDGMDAEEGLNAFVAALLGAGCDALIIHARRAWLQGLNPAQNRSVPPLDYARVRRLKAAFPACPIIINGGVQSLDAAAAFLAPAAGDDVDGNAAALPALDGVMVGRLICRRPLILAEAARRFWRAAAPGKHEVLHAMRAYIAQLPGSERRWALSSLAGLYHGEQNSRRYRQALAAGQVIIPPQQNAAA